MIVNDFQAIWFYICVFIEWIFPKWAWRDTRVRVFTSHTLVVEKAGKLTGRVMVLNKELEWELKDQR